VEEMFVLGVRYMFGGNPSLNPIRFGISAAAATSQKSRYDRWEGEAAGGRRQARKVAQYSASGNSIVKSSKL